MSPPLHTYGPTCLLFDPDVDSTAASESPHPPRVRSQYFYFSAVSIDDSSTPLPSGSSSSSVSGFSGICPPVPFSAADDIALERAWTKLGAQRDVGKETSGKTASKKDPVVAGCGLDTRAFSQSSTPVRIPGVGRDRGESSPPSVSSESTTRVSGNTLNTTTSGHGGSASSTPIVSSLDRFESPMHSPSIHRTATSGSPFARAVRHSRHVSSSPLSHSPFSAGAEGTSGKPRPEPSIDRSKSRPSSFKRRPSRDTREKVAETIPVGVSRLHSVDFPHLKMKPIYWSPINDIAPVIRATWFFKNTMLPVEPDLANKLEAGYLYFRPWTETWQDELTSCVENGPEAEEKIVYPLWPRDNKDLRDDIFHAADFWTRQAPLSKPELLYRPNAAAGVVSQGTEKHYRSSSVIYTNSRDAQILRPNLLPSPSKGRRPLAAIRKGREIGIPVVRGFNRRIWDKLHPPKFPPSSARRIIGLYQSGRAQAQPDYPICYGCLLEQADPKATDLVLVIHGIGQKLSERMESFHFTHAINEFRRQVNMELNNDSVWPGIRQELESITVLPVNWRSALSLEDEDIHALVSQDSSVNHFSLKDITPETMPSVRGLISDVMLDIPYYMSNHKPKMITALVREANRVYRLWCANNPGFEKHGRVHLIAHSLGSVMALDILSNQPTVSPAVDLHQTPVSESIFEFDTKNLFLAGSPAGFFLLLNRGSLLPRRGRGKPGSANEDRQRGVAGEAGTYGCLAVDNVYNIIHDTDPIAYCLNAAVDSHLANTLQRAYIPSSTATFLETMGSVFRWSTPASQLAPARQISAKAATVATTSSATMISTTKQAVESRKTGQSGKSPISEPELVAERSSDSESELPPVRPSLMSDLPSNVELAQHDFSREELAEKRMLLLNDNGQIDYYISGGGGPLSIQYLNMLNAHSSYWVSRDFIRFLVVEIGRVQGREGALASLRPVKKKG